MRISEAWLLYNNIIQGAIMIMVLNQMAYSIGRAPTPLALLRYFLR